MPNVGIMASAYNVPVATCTDVLTEPFNNLTAWTTMAGTPAIVAGRTGTALRLGDASTGTVKYTIPSINESNVVTLGFAFWTNSISTRNLVYLWSDTNTVDHTDLILTSGGALQVQRGSSSGIGTSATGLIVANTWYYIEFQFKLGETGIGTFEVRINGSTILGPTVADTKNGGTKTTYDTIRLNGIASLSNYNLFDDLYISTGIGCAFKGDQVIGAALPIPATGLQLWLDADDATAFTYSSGVLVSQWNDKSSGVRHLSQGTVAAQPSRNGTQNGRTTVVYDGVNDHVRTPALPASTATDNFTAIVACKRTGGSTQSVVFHNGAPNTNGFGVALRANSANIGVLRAAIIFESTSTPDPAAACVITTQRSSGTWGQWLNGTVTNMAATGTINTPSAAVEVTSDSHFFAGEVYEVIFYDRVLTTPERTSIESYLKTKWGTP